MTEACRKHLLHHAAEFNPNEHLPVDKTVIIHTEVPYHLPETLYLSPEEKQKGEKFVKEEDRKAYHYRHHLLRKWLSVWLELPPLQLSLLQNPFGKPFLQGMNLHFNISRSGHELVFAFTPVQVGVDIELIRDFAPFHPVIEQHFHPKEKTTINGDDDFFKIWTRKEAIVKAQGTGLTEDLNTLDGTREEITFHGHHYEIYSYRTRHSYISLAIEKNTFPIESYTRIKNY